MTPRHVTRPALIALAVLAALALLGPVWPGARLSVSTGNVEIGRGEPPVWKPASAGEALGAGDRVRTGESGRAEVVIEGSTLRIYPNSLLRLPEASATRNVGLEKGSSLFDVLHNGEPFEVRTPEVVVSVKGTRFGVELDGDSAAVAVYRGLVGVHADSSGEPETLVHAGFAAFGSDHFELSWHGGNDPWDTWDRGGDLPQLPHSSRHEAALRDTRELALLRTHDLARDGKHGGDGKGKGRGDGDGKGDAEPPAALDPDDTLPGRLRDKLHDKHGDIDDALRDNIVDNVIGNTTGGALTINFIDGSGVPGPDVVEVLDGATSWIFDEDALDDILDDDESLPADLLAILDARGIEEQAFASQLFSLFGGRGGDDDDD